MFKILLSILSLSLLSACSQTDMVPISTEAPIEKSIIALGDSLTAGYGLPETDSYPSQLEVRLREQSYNYRTINA